MPPATSKKMRIVLVKGSAAESSPRVSAGSDVDVVVVENVQQLKHEAHRGPVDGLVVSDNTSPAKFRDALAVVDASKTLILAGPFSVEDACDGMYWLLNRQNREASGRGIRPFRDLTLEEYIESKFGEFVRAMKSGSARSLHATVIRAVEGPLIRHALRETDGNQIQAARLLGMNRNTLRKKINAYRISVKRRSPSRSRREAVS